MIARVWHGWTTPDNAPEYERLTRKLVFPSIEKMKVKGYRKLSLAKRETAGEVEFMTVMLFDDLEAVKAFAGEDYEQSYILPEIDKVLLRHNEKVKHFEIIDELDYA